MTERRSVLAGAMLRSPSLDIADETFSIDAREPCNINLAGR